MGKIRRLYQFKLIGNKAVGFSPSLLLLREALDGVGLSVTFAPHLEDNSEISAGHDWVVVLIKYGAQMVQLVKIVFS